MARDPRRDWHRALISGEERGVWADAARTLLSLAAGAYGCGVFLRNLAYDRGWSPIARAGLPVVSIGNLTTGGTGKTPVTAHVAQWYLARNVRVAIASRGYKAPAAGLNDEGRVLKQLCPAATYLQNHDRVASARAAREQFDCQVLILDDGFQHRRLARDLDIVLIDATLPWGYGHLLPRGLLREPASALRRANLVAITRVDQVSREVVRLIRERITGANPNAEIVELNFPPVNLIDASGKCAPVDKLSARPVAAFCGLGNPQGFEKGLERLGYRVVATRRFPDHHQYTSADLGALRAWAASLDVAAVVTTQKDLVKIESDSLGKVPLWAVQIGVDVAHGADALERRLEGAVRG
ncbi:MAG: tetraacyldisaccharide 4'-kinase [Planctomycetaceae bacterium]